MIELNGAIRLVALQFCFTNPDVVPPSVKRLVRETPEKRVVRKDRSNGFVVIEPTAKCSLVKFPGELEAAGYELVNAFCEERIDGKDARGKRTYYMVRLLFARSEFVDISAEFREVRDTIRAGLQELCESAMWRVRAFSNPFFMDGEEIPGQRAVSINLEAREPLFRPDGQPVVVWQKDERGERVGDAPLPIVSERRLCVIGELVKLMTVSENR